MDCAAKQNMRPSWPPPTMPSHAPGWIGELGWVCAFILWGRSVGLGPEIVPEVLRETAAQLLHLQRWEDHRVRRVVLARAECREFVSVGGLGDSEYGDREQRRVRRAGFADSKRRHGHALGHLHDRMQ